MGFLKQTAAILGMSLSGIPQRLGAALTIIVGVSCAVGVLVSMLAMGTGARRQLLANVRADHVLLSTTGASMGMGSIAKEEAATVANLPGVRKDEAGKPVVLLESIVPVEGRRRLTGVRIYFPLIGITTNVTQYQPELHFTAGRMFQRGLQELIASNPCVRQFSGFGIGDRRHIHGSDWVVTGHFDVGSLQQCIVYGDVDTLMTAFKRNTYSQVEAMLESPRDFEAFAAAVKGNPSLHLEVEHESDAVERQFKQLDGLLSFVSYFVGTIMAIAATLGAVNSLYSIVDSRRRELATLRAIGFGAGAVIASILLESILLALPGALLGGALAWALFSGLAVSPFGFNFRLDVTPTLALLGLGWALAMGLIGGFLPALRAARVSVTEALRAT